MIGDGTTLYTPTNPATGTFQNLNLNSLNSKYAATYGHSTTSLIQKVTNAMIYDAAPAQFMDLKILKQKEAKQVFSDEIYYHEMGFGREPITIGTVGVNIAAASTQTVPVTDLSTVSLDMILVYKDNSRGTVISIDEGLSTITLKAESGQVLPLIATTDSGGFFSNLSPVEADGADDIKQYFRMETVERCNYVQLFVKAMRFGKIEMIKYEKSGTLSNFLSMQKQRFYDQFRISLSNVLWNGNMAEVTLANGQRAKTAGGIFPIMQSSGSPNSDVTLANLPTALEELALDTEFGEYGATRFLYATPRVILYLSKAYKDEKTRYTPENGLAKLGLSAIDIGSTKIVFVPVARFNEPSCFPADFRSRVFLVDQESIQPCYIVPEASGETLPRINGGTRENFYDYWLEASLSIEFYNPLASGYLNITDL